MRVNPRIFLNALFLSGVAALMAAPGFVSTGHAAPALAANSKNGVFTLTSPDFEFNGPMPNSTVFEPGCLVRHPSAGQNTPPTLNWVNGETGFTGFPTLSYALTMVDYDAPVGGGFHHWVIYNIPGTATTLNATTIAESTPGTDDYPVLGYGGPCPPADNQIHHYIFTLYALDIASLGPPAMTYTQVTDAINAAVDSHGINFVVNGATILIGTIRNAAQ